MARIHCQVRIPHKSLINEDAVINTFNFTGVADAETMAPLALGMLKVFYNDLSTPQVTRIKDLLSYELAVAGTRIKIYDLADPEPRVPILDESLGVTDATSSSNPNLPGEVCIGVSYRSEAESGVVAARRRGRIYLGPLRPTVSEGTTSSAARPSAAARLSIALAAAELASGPIGCQWAVWSRTNDAMYPIIGGYIDDAYDTQRRRGVRTSSRQGFSGGLG